MNEFVIYTYGGGDLLAEVLNAIGRIFQSDSAYFTPVGKFALIFGTIWAGVMAIAKSNIGIFGKDYLVPSFLILTLLFAPKTTVWVKDEVSLKAPQKIDNIPLGVSAFVGLSSQLFHWVTVAVEDNLMPVDGLKSHKAGLLFGAKAVAKLQDLRIEDPNLLQNAKEFTKQCWQKPFVIGNLLGKKTEAMKSDDLLQFLKDNTPEWFGVYWKEDDGTVTFKTCRAAIPLIAAGIAKETNDTALRKFGQKAGFLGAKEDFLNGRLKAVMGDALGALDRGQADLNAWMRQSMMLNASREGLDDWRESFGFSRLYPEVVSMNATRGIFQQMTQGLISGEMMADLLPRMHAVLMAVLMAMIFIVYPLSLLPGGFAIFKFWVIALISVTSWPLFFAIIQGVGFLIIQKDGITMGTDEGLSVLSQGAYAEMIMNNFAISQGLCALVPILAWSLISKSSYGLSNMMSSVTGSASGVAASLGSAAAEGNLSMANVSAGNRSFSQQQLAPNVNMGSSWNTGTETMIRAANGESRIMENVDQLGTNYGNSKINSASTEQALSGANSKHKSLQNSFNKSFESRLTNSQNYAEVLRKDENRMNSFSKADRDAINNVASNSMGYQEGFGHQQTKGNTVDARHNASLGMNFAGTGATASTSSGASNTDSMSQDTNAQKQERMENSLSRLNEIAKTDAYQSTDAETKSAAQDFLASHSEVQSYSQALSESKQEVQTFSDAKRAIDSGSQSVTSNMNRLTIDEVKRHIPGLTTDKAAVTWMNEHKAETQRIFNDAQSNKDSAIVQSLAKEGAAMRQSVQGSTQQATPETMKASVQTHAQEKRREVQAAGGDLHHIPQTIEAQKKEIEKTPRIPKPTADQFENKFHAIKKQYNTREDSTNVRAGKQTAQKIKEVHDAHQKYGTQKIDEYVNKKKD
jgi:conjugal transfer mating pair stabilization protein TraG